jgi:anti-anti-sigma factor
VVHRRTDNEAILLLTGRLGRTTAAEFEAATRQVLKEGATRVVLDLSQVDYLSGAALRIIEQLSGELAGKGGRLVLRDPAVPVRLALELSGSLAECIESQGGSAPDPVL